MLMKRDRTTGSADEAVAPRDRVHYLSSLLLFPVNEFKACPRCPGHKSIRQQIDSVPGQRLYSTRNPPPNIIV